MEKITKNSDEKITKNSDKNIMKKYEKWQTITKRKNIDGKFYKNSFRFDDIKEKIIVL